MGRRFDRKQHPVERDGLILDLSVALKHRIERDDIVGGFDLEPVAGENQ